MSARGPAIGNDLADVDSKRHLRVDNFVARQLAGMLENERSVDNKFAPFFSQNTIQNLTINTTSAYPLNPQQITEAESKQSTSKTPSPKL